MNGGFLAGLIKMRRTQTCQFGLAHRIAGFPRSIFLHCSGRRPAKTRKVDWDYLHYCELRETKAFRLPHLFASSNSSVICSGAVQFTPMAFTFGMEFAILTTSAKRSPLRVLFPSWHVLTIHARISGPNWSSTLPMHSTSFSVGIVSKTSVRIPDAIRGRLWPK